MINETWREEEEELVTLHGGHVWCGSGGSQGKHGVGILLHERWSRCIQRWKAINSRLGLLELSINQLKLGLLVVYMPHCGYPDYE
eukprot:633432-Karenia_brevis.AAC.1